MKWMKSRRKWLRVAWTTKALGQLHTSFTLQLVIGEPLQTTTLKHIQHKHNVKIMTNGWGCLLHSYFLLQKVPQTIISHYDINFNMSMKQNTSCCKVNRLELAKYCTEKKGFLIPVKCPVLIHYAWCCMD